MVAAQLKAVAMVLIAAARIAAMSRPRKPANSSFAM
jgi:hypothetical protein